MFNLPPEEQQKRVEDWIHLAEDGANQFQLSHFHLVSDTIFAGGENSIDGLNKILEFSKYMLEIGIRRAFPLRGAITFGEVIWSPKVTFGKAVAQAYEHSNNQNWIGTSCINPLPHIKDSWDSGKVVFYWPPVKKGCVRSRPVIKWKIPPFEELLKFTSIHGLLKDGEILSSTYLNIIQNTTLFSIFLEILDESKLRETDPSRLYRRDYGISPVKMIEFILKFKSRTRDIGGNRSH